MVLFKMIDQPKAFLFQSQFSTEILIENNFRFFLHVPAAVSVNADGRYIIFFRSSAEKTDAAEQSETSCSPDLPPYKMPILIFDVFPRDFIFCHNCL